MALRGACGPNGKAFVVNSRPQMARHSSNGKEFEVNVLFARCAALEERCPPRKTSRVERLKAKVEPRLKAKVELKQQWIPARERFREAWPRRTWRVAELGPARG